MSLPPVDYHSTSSYSYEQPLPPMVRTNAVTQVPPAKKITFYKSGDPQFGGIKMAINQRSFKSFNALMDDLSNKVPLPFGVRAITTPRGIHFISTLDQLEDGGCYLCSDKKYVTPLNIGVASRRLGPQKIRRPTSAFKRVAQDIKQEDYPMAFTQQGPRIPKKITLIKNGDIATQLPIILNRRNAQSFKVLLDEISEIMQFTVRKLYTVDGKRIDSVQGLLLCPDVLICVGQEPFKPVMMQNPKKHSSEKLPGLASHSSSNPIGKKNEMNFGLKAKKSVIHPRSSLSNRSMRFSLSSEKSYINGPATSPENGIPSLNNCLHSKGADLVPSLVNDDIEKKVYMNKDGSLSVEMKVRFHLLTDETLQWSTQIKKSNLMNETPCEESDVREGNQIEPREKINQETSFEIDDSLYPCDTDSYISNLGESEIEETYCHICSKPHSNYDIWKNPMHVSQKKEPGITNTWYTHSSCSSTSSHQRIVHKKKASTDSIHTLSNERKHSEHIIQKIYDYSEVLGNKIENGGVENCCCLHDQTNTSQKEAPEEMNGVASLTSSENEDESIVRKERDESKGNRARSNKSEFQYSIESQIKVLEETSSVIRTISSHSIKEREEIIGCSSSANSACSKSSKCSIFGTKDKLGKISDNNHIASSYYQIPSSLSSDDCSPKIVSQVEVEKEDEDNNEINSISENRMSNHLIKDEVSKCGRNSRNRFFQSKVCNEDDRSDSSEMDMPSVALSASRIFNRSKCNQNYSKGDSKVSGGSSRESTIKKKKTKGPLHVEDGRSSSKTTYYSENSKKVGKRDKEGQTSDNSNSPQSNVSSLSEAAASNEENASRISKCYSKSSKSSHKRSQLEDTNKLSSSVSNFLESDRKNGAGTAKISTQANTSRQGNIAEFMCSKCGHIAETRNNYLQCASSKILLYSDAKSTCSEMQASENNDVSSQSSIAQSSKPRQKKRSNVHASLKYCSQVSDTASATLYNFHSPVPPRERPSSKNSQSLLMNINSALVCTELEPAEDELQKEMAGSQLPEMDTVNDAENNLDIWKENEGSWQEKRQVEEEAVARAEAASENYDQIIPSSLPNASPEEVVHEWLRKIPSESLLMKCEMQKDEEKIELHAEVPSCSNNQESLEEKCSEKEDTEDCEKLAEKEYPQEEKASEMISEGPETNEGECHSSVIHGQNNHKKDLPNAIQISVQIMKTLLASKHEAKSDRSYSLPEMSPTLGRKLSNSANILIQCLASLQLLDEEWDPSNKQNKCLNWFRYKELLNIFQAEWFGNTSEKGGTNSGLRGKGQMKASSGFKGPNSKDGDFTPMTSSGIDVSSGDGGSGEESGVGAHVCALLKVKRDKAKFPEEGKPGEEDGNVKESEENSQPTTLCSKLESEKQPKLAGVQELIQATVDQHHENSKEKELDKNCKCDDQNVDGAENDSNADNVLMEAQTGTMAKEVEKNLSEEDIEEAGNNETEPDSSINETIDEKEPKINSEKQFVNKDDTESSNISHQTAVISPAVSPMIQQRSISPDPVWVLKLLKKIEKEFMTHYVSAMNEFKVKWNLPNSEELDLMIAELKEEVNRRIQKTVEKELNKIRSRAGKKIPKPPANELRHESTPNLENRRRRLTSMLSLSNINEQSTNLNNELEPRGLSYDIDKDDFLYSTIQDDDRYDDQLTDEEYCPCDVCIRKKIVAKAAQRTVVVMARAPTPVMKAFDLQELLRMKTTNVVHRKAEHDISELGQEEEAKQTTKKTVECKAEQEAKYDEAKEADGIKEQKVQEANEDETLADSERVFKNQNCEELEEDKEEGESVKEEEEEHKEEEKTIIEEEIPASSGEKFENNASIETRCEVCSETTEVEEEDENKEGDEAVENEAEQADSNESVQNTEDDRGTEQNGDTEGPEILRKGSECRSDGDVSKEKENIGNEDGDCGSDGEAKLVAESRHTKMYPDSNEEEEEDLSSQASIVMGEDPQNEENEDSDQFSKKKEQNSKAIDQEDLDF
ncbi:retinitis pigmentosa 1-like 1 protein [Liasis olivaceus]